MMHRFDLYWSSTSHRCLLLVGSSPLLGGCVSVSGIRVWCEVWSVCGGWDCDTHEEGSSRKTIFGFPISAIARLRRRFIPPVICHKGVLVTRIPNKGVWWWQCVEAHQRAVRSCASFHFAVPPASPGPAVVCGQ